MDLNGLGGRDSLELDGVVNNTKPKFKYLKLEADQVQLFINRLSRGSSLDLIVWMLALNALRVNKSASIDFTPRWRTGVSIAAKTLNRCLHRLHQAGLLSVEFRRGKSARIHHPGIGSKDCPNVSPPWSGGVTSANLVDRFSGNGTELLFWSNYDGTISAEQQLDTEA